MSYSDAYLKSILDRTRVIAVVGVSPNPVRPSHYVARYLGLKKYRVIPVNPAKCPSVNVDAAQTFADWLVSDAGQDAIAAYKVADQQLFFPNAPEN